nr:immunoglobulin light chain junction region [Macaca mulatta]MOY09803.1 immunoglobulin light chain junction region [Macaca mulatta]
DYYCQVWDSSTKF